MFENWQADQIDDAELAKNHAYLLGSFWNPEQVKKLLGEGSNVYNSTETGFDETTKLLKTDAVSELLDPKKKTDKVKRKRRKIKV